MKGMNMVEELKPCPFCGTRDISFDRCSEHSIDITCWSCKAGMSWSPDEVISMGPEGNSKEAAASAWNARPDNAGVLNELVEAVKALCVDADYMDRTALDFEAVEDALAKLDGAS